MKGGDRAPWMLLASVCVSDSITRIGVGIPVGPCTRPPYFGQTFAPIGQCRLHSPIRIQPVVLFSTVSSLIPSPYTVPPCYFRYSTRFSCKLSLLSSDQISTFLCVLFFFFFHRLLFRFAENKFPFVDGGEGRYNARTFLSHQGVNRFDSRRESRN